MPAVQPGAALRAAPRRDVERQRLDQARLLGERDELVGRDEAALRVLPAQQRLDRSHLAVGQDGLRLVVQRELALLDRAPQLAHERQPRRVVRAGAGRRRTRSRGSRPWRGTWPHPPGAAASRRPRRRRGRRRCRSTRSIESGRPWTAIGLARIAERTRSTTASMSAAIAASGSSRPNSSPPSRATVSEPRTTVSSRRATSTSSSSPAAWPRESLISLKRSRSIISTPARAAAVPRARAPARRGRGTACGSAGR